MRAPAWIALSLASVAALAVLFAIRHRTQDPVIHVTVRPEVSREEKERAREIAEDREMERADIEHRRARFEGNDGTMQLIAAHTLLERSIAIILRSQGRGQYSESIFCPAGGPKKPLYESDSTPPEDATLTISTTHWTYRFNQHEFPEYATCNDMLLRISSRHSEAQLVSDELTGQVLARADEAIALLRSAPNAK